MAQDLTGGQLGKYQIMSVIGRGGMGIVYLAHDPALKRDVAIKVLAPHLVWEQGFVERFLREARAAARLEHPNLVTIYDVGQQGNWYFYVMEYVQGQNLTDLIQTGKTGAAETTLDILSPLADAMDYAHGQGLVHRDIKPANILVTAEGKVKLTDFGIAKAAQETGLTTTGAAIGTPEYMSPEQARGEEVGLATDGYSLGIVAYEMLSGRAPFEGTTPFAVLHKQIYEPPPPIRDVREDLPAETDRVLGAALAKDPASRYEALTDFVADLERALKGEKPLLPAALAAKTRTRKMEAGPPSKRTVTEEKKPARVLLPWLLAFGAVLAIAIAAIVVVLILRGGMIPGSDPTPTPDVIVVIATPTSGVESPASPAPTATSSSTSTPLPTSTAIATATIEPTSTRVPATIPPSATLPAAPTATSRPTSTATTSEPTPAEPSPSPRPPAEAPHPAPGLMEPAQDATYSGCKEQITFRWTPVGDLAENEYYALSIDHSLGTDETWTKATEWSIQDIDPFMEKNHNYLCDLKPKQWYVVVKSKAGESDEGQPFGPERGAASEKRKITWAPASEPDDYPPPSHGYLSSEVRESPVQAVGFAIVSLSAVLGMVISRRRSSRGRNKP